MEVNGKRQSQELAEGETKAVFELSAGPAELDVWFQAEGREREIVRVNNTLGDVLVRRLNVAY